MKWSVFLFILLMMGAVRAQQMLPLTEWRAQIDFDLGKISMSREAHGQVIGILQAAERAAQQEKIAKAKEPVAPKEGQ